MVTNDKLKVIDRKGFTQSYLPVGTVCEFVKSFDSHTCVRFEGREILINKNLLIPIIDKEEKKR